MEHMSLLKRVGLGVIIVGVVVLPVVLVLFSSPRVKTYFSVFRPLLPRTTTNRFSARSDVAAYRLRLMDTQFLDFMTSKFRLFEPSGVVDPLSIRGNNIAQSRTAISRVSIVLVDTVENPIGIIVQVGGKYKNAMIGQGAYTIQGDTLELRVALDFDKLSGEFTEKYALEDTLLRSVLNTLYYATGELGAEVQQRALLDVKKQMESYVYAGLFPWSFAIERI